MESMLLQLFVFFIASAIIVPIAKRLGLGSVLGYLIAGIVIGPFGLELIQDVESVMHITEFGVVMMLFLVGLELKPSMLWKMRTPIVGTGGAQVLISTCAIGAIAIFFMPWQQALAIGLTLALSSTAIVVQTLKEKGLMSSASGRSVFSVLLFQDLAVIPILAILPLLGTATSNADSHNESALVNISGFPEVAQVGIVILALILIFVSAKYISKPIFRIVAQTKIRELFVATALAMVLGISLLMTIVGLSPALGTFVAGVVLADSEYRHELESDIEPFKGLLLGIFFITIGASLDFILISKHLIMILGITFGLIAVKFIVLYVIGIGFKMEKKERSFFAVSLAQGGEFAFVLFTFMNTNGIMDRMATAPYISAVALTMFITPFLFKIYEKIVESKVSDVEDEEMDTIEEKGKKVILAGFGRVGTDVGRFLLSAGIKPVILDNDATNVKILRKFGYEVYYGDISRMDLLEAAGAEEAELLIMTMDDIEVSKKLVELIKKHYPNLKIIANSKNLEATYKLMEENIEGVRNETFGTALMLGQDALEILGKDPYDAYRMMRIFRKHNEDMINKLYKRHQEEPENYISEYQRQMANLEEMMILDVELESEDLDKAWTRANPDQ